MPHSGTAADRERLEHMLQAARDAITIAASRRREELDSDILLKHALVHCVQLLGEAAARLQPTSRVRVPDLPWARIVGMRHILRPEKTGKAPAG
jgi:uncharacterized protein with HEPN domain